MHPHEYAKARAGAPPSTDPPSGNHVAGLAGVTPQSARGPPSPDDDAFLTGGQTRARVGGVSPMCIWRWMRDPRVQFPHPTKINGRNYWRLGDLRRWQSERTARSVAA
jgi:predicted DNA-binding transcriptional regulator AlpA